MLSDLRKLGRVGESKQSVVTLKENWRWMSDPTCEEKKRREELRVSKSVSECNEKVDNECDDITKERSEEHKIDENEIESEMAKETVNGIIAKEKQGVEKEQTNANDSIPLMISWCDNGLRCSMWKLEYDTRKIRIENGQLFESCLDSINDATRNSRFFLRRYLYEKLLVTTLQGYTCVVKDQPNNRQVVVKVANKTSIQQKKTLNGVYVAEDFCNEIALLNQISNCAIPHHGIVKPICTWQTQSQVYLAMEYCPDGSLYEYLTHVLVKQAQLQPKNVSAEDRIKWMKNDSAYSRFVIVQNLFLQMVSIIYYLHHTVAICHRDLSLENFVVIGGNSNKPVVKLIDFGLARICGSGSSNEEEEKKKKKKIKKQGESEDEKKNRFNFNEAVGKTRYQSPECYDCRHKHLQGRYDGRLNDTHCLGVCLFLMLFGFHPYHYPTIQSDAQYARIIQCGFMPIIQANKFQFLVNEQTVDLLDHLLTLEPNRLFIEQIAKHPFFTPCTLSQL